MTRPSVFIGSSSEAEEFAHAAREALDQDAEVISWDEGFAELGRAFIDTLVARSTELDFAVLILTPDDPVTSRKTESRMPRDNVVFELGLFMGALGRSRTFLLTQGGDVKIPSDLAGVTTATFRWPRSDGSHRAAIGAACDKIRREIRRQGPLVAATQGSRVSIASASGIVGSSRSASTVGRMLSIGEVNSPRSTS